jgi:hypothetical protein
LQFHYQVTSEGQERTGADRSVHWACSYNASHTASGSSRHAQSNRTDTNGHQNGGEGDVNTRAGASEYVGRFSQQRL